MNPTETPNNISTLKNRLRSYLNDNYSDTTTFKNYLRAYDHADINISNYLNGILHNTSLLLLEYYNSDFKNPIDDQNSSIKERKMKRIDIFLDKIENKYLNQSDTLVDYLLCFDT
jgi:hypothetical protein